ncbi:peroxisomal N(1)-acetyl-spermine/spermidine oxidase-like [Puntigrus tetrazona]|uniref:peroxisomal N(1)-acetyl-spermine/spermidine oxidase-like n=1 Tax=Puntigrus tetrazona TaxID=1606681 RepID=UPI001C8A33A9|nr:peroxisomal N(1)-acetyl-spermine/spermidine oxidase-like [Puntigrus tetrazona]
MDYGCQVLQVLQLSKHGYIKEPLLGHSALPLISCASFCAIAFFSQLHFYIFRFFISKHLNKAARMSCSGHEDAKVVIVGSGFAGLAAAATLVKAGFENVLVLEAKERIGGRVHTTKPFTESIIEVGANWIHGQTGNPLYKIAKEENLLSKGTSASTSETSDDYFFKEDGKKVPSKLADQVCSQFTTLTDKAYDDELEPKYQKLTLGAYLDDAFGQSPLGAKQDGQQVFEWCKRNECTDEACSSLYEMSASEISNYTTLDGDFYTTLGPGGYRAILDVLMRDLRSGTIQCNSPVKSIHWDLVKKGHCEDQKHPVQVVCENGKSFDADHVIVTVSLGVLKDKASTMFEPSLPPTKLSAIKNLGFGIVDKIFLFFEKKFWPDDCAGVQMVWKEGPENKDVYKSLSNGDAWKKTWYKKITGFDAEGRHPTALCGWITGREALYMENLPDSEIKDTCLRLLRSFTGWSVPEVSKMLISRWGSDSHVHGSYTFVPDGVDGVKAQKALASPLPPKDESQGRMDLQVLFAGEATHDSFYTTTHGAYLSGVREANRLVNYYTD